MRDVQVAIDVPSGKLVVDNDLRDLFPDVEDMPHIDGQGVQFWMKAYTEAYGKIGLLHGYVGNSCPSVYKYGDTLYIGNQPSDVEWSEYKKRPFVAHPQIPGKRVAGVCTDLWWYSICDHDEFIRRGGKVNRSVHPWQNPDIVKVRPGRYVLSHHWPFTDGKDSYREKRMVYATIKWSYKLVIPWLLPEEKLFMELGRILPELKWIWIRSNQDRSQFNLFLIVERPGFRESAKLDIPADLVIGEDYGSIAVLVKKELWKERKQTIDLKRRMSKLEKKLTPVELRRQRKILEETLRRLEKDD